MKNSVPIKLFQLSAKYCRQFTKLSEISFSLEFFTTDFLKISSIIVKNCLLGSRLGT